MVKLINKKFIFASLVIILVLSFIVNIFINNNDNLAVNPPKIKKKPLSDLYLNIVNW